MLAPPALAALARRRGRAPGVALSAVAAAVLLAAAASREAALVPHLPPRFSAPHLQRQRAISLCAAAGESEAVEVAAKRSEGTEAADAEAQRRSPGVRRLGGRGAPGKAAPGRPTQAAASGEVAEEEGPDVFKTVAAVLLALFLGRAVLGGMLFGGVGGGDQDTYYFSSRSMVSVTTLGEDGQRRTSVKEDSSVRTNIPGLQAGDRAFTSQRLLPFDPFS
mmetsp:Transcript_5817/g.11677  ORF Transcript_5817/g.11677 Transcript_5817/m.11677 type:complete len:220 (+) Transcript_5817:39-698(+)